MPDLSLREMKASVSAGRYHRANRRIENDLNPSNWASFGLFRNFGADQIPIMRERRRSIPALPYMERLMSFSLLIFSKRCLGATAGGI